MFATHGPGASRREFLFRSGAGFGGLALSYVVRFGPIPSLVTVAGLLWFMIRFQQKREARDR